MLGFSKSSDHTILERIQQGDEKVLLHLYKDYRKMVAKFVLKNNGSEDDIDEVLQTSIIGLWKNATKPDFLLHSKLSTYFMGIVKNVWFKTLKKNTKFKYVNPQESLKDVPVDDKINLDKTIIHQMVAELDETCKKLLTYFYFDGFANTVIAEKLGFANADTVKSKKYQCFKKLQARVTEDYKKEDLI